MKRSVLILVLLLLISGSSVFAIGVGGAWTFGVDNIDAGGSGVFLLSHPSIPGDMLGISFQLNQNVTAIGVSDDWWLFNEHLTGVLHLTMGPGFYAGGVFMEDNTYFNFGGRVAIDLRAFLMDPFEIFVQYAPAVGIGGLGSSEGVTFPEWNFTQFAIGFRFWF